MNEKKNHHDTIKIFIAYKFQRSATPLMGIEYALHLTEKIGEFLQISFKGQSLIIVIVLVLLHLFETTCLIISFIFDIWEVLNLLIHFSRTKSK